MCCHAVPASAGGGLVSGLLLAAEALTLHESPLCSIWQSVRRLAIVGMGVFALGLHTVRASRQGDWRAPSARGLCPQYRRTDDRRIHGPGINRQSRCLSAHHLAMNHWLDQFAYRQDPGLFVFFASGIAVLLVTWLTGRRSGAANRVA